MRSAQRSVRAHRQHPQCSTRQVAARHRSADLPGQADGSHKHPSATYAALTRDTGERQRAPPSAPSAPRTRKSPPQCAAHSSAPAPPSEHTHIESTCRRSRRTPQVQFSLSTPHESSVAGQPATASGVAEMLASCHRLRRQRRADAALRQSSVSVQPRASARRTPLHRPWCERQQAIQRARSAPRSPITATMRCVSEPHQVQPHRHYVSWGVPLARIPYILH